MARHTYGLENIKVCSWGEGAQLHIGSFCSIADNVTIFLGGNHRTDWVTTYPFGHIGPWDYHGKGHPSTKGDVIIGNDVWLGSGCTIMSGVKIGDGAIVSARAVVTKDIPAYSIAAGNPARIVKKRFTGEQIDALLAKPWWELDDNRIQELIPLLCSDNVDELICALYS
jgi:acetyltransferase-like isoleucine patch superfamily enzyme